ncbi:MAG: putative toxin-antitoxin system toxin component, PIN family [Campylobacterales bacterium]|nr:putative toxin-antitoxin system toxin component, PIN family [Campylobacterales bacterium]
MKVVIDTNVWISALISNSGGAREIIRLALQEQIIPQISTTLFLEYEGVMKREMIQNLCALSASEQDELFNAFASTCQWNEIYYLWRPNLKDEGDDFLIELAIASNASIIITDNIKDLTSGELHFEIEVFLTPQQFLERITS